MYRRIGTIGLIFLLATSMGIGLAPQSLFGGTVSCLSGKCHPDISVKRYLHGPIGSGSCDVCHQVSRWPAGEHPSLLTTAHATVCLHCHEEAKGKTQAAHVHTVVERGECTACHDPHQGDNPFLLVWEGETTRSLCLSCHDEGSPFWSTGFHGSVALLSCDTCHDPHSSPNRLQLTRYVKTVYIRDHLALGKEDFGNGAYREALRNLNLVLIVTPEELTALSLAARAHLALQEVDEAEALVTRLLKVNPLDAQGYHLKGLTAIARGKPYQAISYLQQSRSLGTSTPGVLLDLGRLQLETGMHHEAMATLTEAAQNEPGNREIQQALEDVRAALQMTGPAEPSP